jgi:hypothetical protein
MLCQYELLTKPAPEAVNISRQWLVVSGRWPEVIDGFYLLVTARNGLRHVTL